MSRSINLAVIPGDGIGQEVVAQGLKVLNAVLPEDVKLETKEYDLGARRWHRTGETLPDAELEALKQHDAILLGAIGDPSVPSGVLERGLLLKLRFAFDHFVNLRPSKLFPNTATPLVSRPEIDFVVVREGTEGPYTGNGGSLRTGTPAEVATEVSVNTAYGVERVVRDAFARAQARPRKKLTLVHKNNVLVFMRPPVEEHLRQGRRRVPGRHHRLPARRRRDDLLRHPARAVRRHRHRQPLRRHHHRPRRGRHRRHRPGRLRQRQPDGRLPVDVRAGPRLRPDIAGQGKADPTAAILSVALLLRHLGYETEAARIEEAVSADLAERDSTARSTDAIGDALAGRVVS